MSPVIAFELSVPAEPRFRALAPEVAGKYAELAGGSADVSARVAQDVERVAADLARSGDQIGLTFAAAHAEVTVTLQSGARTATVRCPLSR